jgi:hypothetical protein
MESPIFLNPNVVRSSVDNRLIDIAFFGKDFYHRYRNEIRKLTINDCLDEGNFKTIREFQLMNLPLSISTWVGLRSAVYLARKKIAKCDSPPVILANFLRGIRKAQRSSGK